MKKLLGSKHGKFPKSFFHLQNAKADNLYSIYTMSKVPQRLAMLICFFLVCVAIGLAGMLRRESITINGVSIPIIMQFVGDEAARKAYLKEIKKNFMLA